MECEGHPAGPNDPMGETVYCDGSCQNAKLERPYIVCDRCGHQVTADQEEPSVCENCGSTALWAFPDPGKADQHSQDVVERNDASDTHALNERAWDRSRR